MPLAVAVNGKLVAFSETYGAKNSTDKQFWTMLPPKLLRNGRNEIRLYVVKGDPAHPSLEAISLR